MQEEKNNTILVADDDQFIRQVVNKALSNACETVEVIDGADVLEVYEKTMPDVLLLDVHLPNISGLELIPQILELHKDAYIVMLTSDSTAEKVRSSIAAGAKGFISKPFEKQVLLDNIKRCPTISL